MDGFYAFAGQHPIVASWFATLAVSLMLMAMRTVAVIARVWPVDLVDAEFPLPHAEAPACPPLPKINATEGLTPEEVSALQARWQERTDHERKRFTDPDFIASIDR